MCIYKEIATNVKTCADAPIIHRSHYIEGPVSQGGNRCLPKINGNLTPQALPRQVKVFRCVIVK